jgi:hypothetical protein
MAWALMSWTSAEHDVTKASVPPLGFGNPRANLAQFGQDLSQRDGL